MQIFGAYDRLLLSGEGLLSAAGCDDAARVRRMSWPLILNAR
jgi:hypothetical protein